MTLTNPLTLSMYPAIKEIELADLRTCTIPVSMDPAEITSDGVVCNICPEGFVYDDDEETCFDLKGEFPLQVLPT